MLLQKNNDSAFTLIELIVVITILTVLGAIGFGTLTGYLGGARDGARLTDMNSIYSQLNISAGTNGKLPYPEDYRTITYNSGVLTYQGFAGKTVLDTIKFEKGGRDPKDNTYYTYTVDKKRKQAQLLGYFESYDTSKLAYIDTITKEITPKAQAATTSLPDYSDRIVGVIGKNIGTLVESGTLVPVQVASTGALDIGTTTTPYVAYFNSTTIGNGTGSDLSTDFLGKSSVYKAEVGRGVCTIPSPYSSSTTYYEGQCFTYNGETITVLGTGYGKGDLTAEPGCTNPDIAIWNGANIQIWSACNVGATVAGTGTITQSCPGGCADLTTDYSDSIANFGGYFQWGNNGNLMSGIPSTTGQPSCPLNIDSSYSQTTTFYMSENDINYDWCSGAQNDNLWGDVTNTSTARKGPCQTGYHTPTGGTSDTTTEWGTAYTIANAGSIGSCNQAHAYDRIQCILLLPLPGYRNDTDGVFYKQGYASYYWTSSPSNEYANAITFLFVSGGGTVTYSNIRSGGLSVRCLKN